MLDKYVYKRKDGGETWCYGTIKWDSNFEVVCQNEYNDGVWTGDLEFDPVKEGWEGVCKYLEEYYDPQIEQLQTC